tara:strand:- start:352 stop:1680 length:1329 start_codon:yes stop_codon:yes gene_type:complete
MLFSVRICIYCALISFVGAQDCSTIFENNSKDSSYWYGFAIQDISRKSKIKKVSEEVLASSVKNLSFSIYSNIVANESQIVIDEIANNKNNFSNKFISNVTVSTDISGIEYEVVSQGKCDKQYYSLVRLQKNSFISRENIRYNSLINKSENLSLSSFSNLFDYLTYINQLFVDFDSLLIGVFEPSYQSKIDFEKNNLQSEYLSIISSLKASFSYSLPYSKYDKRPNNLEITFKSEIVNLPLSNGSVYLKYFGKSNEYFFNSSGKILFNINDSVRSKETVDLEILLNLNKLLEDHNLFKIKKLNNPKYNFVISDEPLVFHYEDNFDDEELSKFLYKNFKINIFGKININLIENENAPYKIEIEASDLTKNFNEQTKQYIYILRDVNFKVVDKVTNQQVFIINKATLKGVSFQSFGKAAKRIEKDLRVINQEIKNELHKKILIY